VYVQTLQKTATPLNQSHEWRDFIEETEYSATTRNHLADIIPTNNPSLMRPLVSTFGLVMRWVENFVIFQKLATPFLEFAMTARETQRTMVKD